MRSDPQPLLSRHWAPAIRRRIGGSLALATLCVALSACELPREPLAPTEPTLIVHGVLSSSASSQVILLEESWSGRRFVPTLPFNAADPIITNRGLAVSGATVTLTLPDGHLLTAREDAAVRSDGLGAGVYRVALAGAQLQGGGAYRLQVLTRDGRALDADTRMPSAPPTASQPVRTFARESAPLALEWPISADATAYAVVIESANGPHVVWADAPAIALSGTLRHTELAGLPRVFTAGFQQSIAVLAVDANYRDYLRSSNTSWRGTGTISRVRGGLGVFGAVAPIQTLLVRVEPARHRPIEGRFVFEGTAVDAAASIARELDLWVDAAPTVADQPAAISGRYTPWNGAPSGITGTLLNGELRVVFHRGFSLRDTLERFTATLAGDTLAGRYANYNVPGRFVRQP